MDVDQLISGIGSAVASAQSQNICVFWCMTKSEWASWVQAGGSVVAIFSGFYLTRKTLRVQNQQHLQRDIEAKRVKDRMQYCVLADLFEATEAWGNEMARTIVDPDTYNIDSSIYIGQSVIDSLRSVSNEQLPAVDSIRRINMAVLSTEAVVAGLKIVKSLEGDAATAARHTVKFRANRLRKIASVDKDFCNRQADDISTAEEIAIRRKAEESRAQALTELFSK